MMKLLIRVTIGLLIFYFACEASPRRRYPSFQAGQNQIQQIPRQWRTRESRDVRERELENGNAQELEDSKTPETDDENTQEPEEGSAQETDDENTQESEDNSAQETGDENTQEPEEGSTKEPKVESGPEPEECEEPAEEVEGKKCVTIDAAMGYKEGDNQVLELFVGDKVQILINYVSTKVQDRMDFAVPKKLGLQAAFVSHDNLKGKHFYGRETGYYFRYTNPMKKMKFKYIKFRTILSGGGPDAAGKLGQKVYFFKGCQIIVRHKWNNWDKLQLAQTVGLPCDVDAAWSEPQGMVVLKGNQFWVWNESNGEVSGPTPFHAKYQLLDGWHLKPAPLQTTEGPSDLTTIKSLR